MACVATLSVAAAAGSACMGARYGKNIVDGEYKDHLGLRHARPAVINALERGFIKGYQIGTDVCAGPPGLSFLFDEVTLQPTPIDQEQLHSDETTAEVQHFQGFAGNIEEFLDLEAGGSGAKTSFPGQAQKLDDFEVSYLSTVVGNTVWIASDQVPAFLLDNDIQIFGGREVCNYLQHGLAASMSLTECCCLAEYGRNHALRDPTAIQPVELPPNLHEAMQPGDVTLWLHMDSDFSIYQQDPKAYEEKLKSEILHALHIDAAQVPGAMKGIKILDVKAGSIAAVVIIGGAVLAAATLICATIYMHVRPKARTRFPAVVRPAPASNQRPAVAPGPLTGQLTSAAAASIQYPAAAPSPATVQPADDRMSHTGTETPPSRQSSVSLVSLSSDPDLTAWTLVPNSAAPNTPPVARGPRLEVENVRLISDADGRRWHVVCRFATDAADRCYLPHTLFKTSNHNHTEAQGLKVNDVVLSASGKQLRVASIQILPQQIRNLVILRTAQSQLTVSESHRMVVPKRCGYADEKLAGELHNGDEVFCGLKKQQLTKVNKFTMEINLVEIRFDPDDPVEARLAPRWGILTRGARFWRTSLTTPLCKLHKRPTSAPAQFRVNQ